MTDITEPLLAIIATMYRELDRLTRRVLESVRVEPICRQLMTIPGVGPLTALALRATVDQPERFPRSRDVGAHLGLTPRHYQSGETYVQERVSPYGDELALTLLYEATHRLLTRCKKWSPLKAWGMNVARRRCMARARVAVARKLAVIMHRMWCDQSEFRWGTRFTSTNSSTRPSWKIDLEPEFAYHSFSVGSGWQDFQQSLIRY